MDLKELTLDEATIYNKFQEEIEENFDNLDEKS